MANVLVLGGGFGGLAAANALRAALPAAHGVTVVDDSERFHVGAGKTWIMLGERTLDEISAPRAALLGEGIRLVPARVEAIDVAGRRVVAGGEALAWDHLVIALGADLDPSLVPGLQDAAHTFYSVAGAERLAAELERFTGGDIVLLIPRAPFKCPPAPYEAALLLHAALESRGLADRTRLAVHTVEGAPMATAGPEMGRYVVGELAARGIAFHPRRAVERVDGAARRVVFADGDEAPYDLLIAVPPHVAPAVVRDAGLVNAAGWVPVDPGTLEVRAGSPAPGVYAVGDVTTLPLPGRFAPDVPLVLPKAGVFAEAQGRVVAERIAAAIHGREPSATFDGQGFCYLETGGGRAVRAEGSFFALPYPTMAKRTPDEAQLRDKLDWVAHLLRPRTAAP